MFFALCIVTNLWNVNQQMHTFKQMFSTLFKTLIEVKHYFKRVQLLVQLTKLS
jgi:hypothetical protein